MVSQDNNGNTALHWAVESRNVSAISLLLDKNTSLTVPNGKVNCSLLKHVKGVYHNQSHISIYQGATCFKLLVQDKPPWLGPRLLQRILDRAVQCDKEAREDQRSCATWIKSFRNFKVLTPNI